MTTASARKKKGLLATFVNWVADRPGTFMGSVDQAIEDIISKCYTLPAINALILWGLVSILLIIFAFIFSIDARSQFSGYTEMFGLSDMQLLGVVTISISWIAVAGVNALQSFGMMMPSTSIGGLVWAGTSALNVYVNVKYLPGVIPQANDPYWNLFLAFALAEIPQAIMLLCLRAWLNLAPIAISGAGGVIGFLVNIPNYAKDGFHSAPKNVGEHIRNRGGGLF